MGTPAGDASPHGHHLFVAVAGGKRLNGKCTVFVIFFLKKEGGNLLFVFLTGQVEFRTCIYFIINTF